MLDVRGKPPFELRHRSKRRRGVGDRVDPRRPPPPPPGSVSSSSVHLVT